MILLVSWIMKVISIDMGYEWDLINGYMGGEKKDKKITYERALAMT